MNVFTCTTRCYKDAEQRFTPAGVSVVTFKGAVDAGFGQNKTTSWIKFTLWDKRGESVLPYLKDKTQVCVSGELANREYTDKDGQKRYSLEVRVNELTLVGGKPEGGQRPANSQDDQSDYAPAQQRSAQGATTNKAKFDDLGEDIPF